MIDDEVQEENQDQQLPSNDQTTGNGSSNNIPSTDNNENVGVTNSEEPDEDGTYHIPNIENIFSDFRTDTFNAEQHIASAKYVFFNYGMLAGSKSSINFQKLSRNDYPTELAVQESELIEVVCQHFHETLYTSRVLAINNVTAVDSFELALVGALTLGEADSDSFSCVIESGAMTLLDLINYFSKDRRCIKKRKKYLIINEKRDNQQMVGEFVRSLLRKGAAGAQLKSMLTELDLRVIYVCALPEFFLTEANNIGICTIDTLTMLIFHETGDYVKAHTLSVAIKNVTLTTGWLSRETPEVVMEKIRTFIVEGTIDHEIAKQKANINEEEERAKLTRYMVEDPLKNIILFTACFFEKISPREFNKLVLLFLETHNSPSQNTVSGITDHMDRWNNYPDSLIEECGLLKEEGFKGAPAYYRFEKLRCHELTREIFTCQFTQVLIRRFEKIRQTLLIKDFDLSENCVNGIVTLAFINAFTETENVLIDICMRLVDFLVEAEEHVAVKIYLRLLAFLQKWQSNTHFAKSVENLYANLKSNQQYRTVFLTLFTVLCTPEYPANLDKLKVLLSSMQRDELFSGIHNNDELEMLGVIYENYADHFSDLISVINDWITRKDERISQTYAYIICAMLRLLQAGRMSKISRAELGYKLLRSCMGASDAKEKLVTIAAFVFSTESKLGYMQLFREDYGVKNRRAASSDLFLIYAFILIHWYRLFQTLSTDLKESALDADNCLLLCLQTIKLQHGRDDIYAGLKLAILKYNMQILKESNAKTTGSRKEEMIQKRNAARIILDLLDQA